MPEVNISNIAMSKYTCRTIAIILFIFLEIIFLYNFPNYTIVALIVSFIFGAVYRIFEDEIIAAYEENK